MDILKIELGSRSYPIVFETSFDTLPEQMSSVCKGRKTLLVTDTNVEPLYADAVEAALEQKGFAVKIFTFTAGEASKNINVLSQIYTAAIEAGLDRKSSIVALGGGVAGDMAGFAAASYMRGIDFIQVPTTLLAQVDSSVGGKVAIDFGGVKNIVGAFYQPKLVYINTSALKSLDKREFAAGMAEVIKYGVIYDDAFLDKLTADRASILALKDAELIQAVRRCCEIKAEVVSQDETEQGLRAILNFGHTIGHGIESAMNFALLHGECVGLGMIAACKIAADRGLISKAHSERVSQAIKAYGLPVKVDNGNKTAIKKYMMSDKKQESGVLRFILPVGPGRVSEFKDVTETEIDSALQAIGGEAK